MVNPRDWPQMSPPPSVWMEWQVVMPKSPQDRVIYTHGMGNVLNSERMWP